ncbi:MAG: peptide-methionine (R)-S-oxide reductase MsrB [Breznakia sp.]
MKKIIYFAGGCFWGVEQYAKNIFGVLDCEVGYANGKTAMARYETLAVSEHAETVKITYDSQVISLRFLLELLFYVVDPTSLNKQGNDKGRQYRSGIYYVEEADVDEIFIFIKNLEKQYKEIVVEVEKLSNYIPAETYHQDYLVKNPKGYCHIAFDAIRALKEIKVDPYQYASLSKQEIRKTLSKKSYDVMMKGMSERPFTSSYNDFYEDGIYVDRLSNEPLFCSLDKYDAGCGWPSFTKPIDMHSIIEKEDTSYGMQRVETIARVSCGHLGHVFEDGPKNQGGMRYCINGAALRFVDIDEMEKEGYGYLEYLFKNDC